MWFIIDLCKYGASGVNKSSKCRSIVIIIDIVNCDARVYGTFVEFTSTEVMEPSFGLTEIALAIHLFRNIPILILSMTPPFISISTNLEPLTFVLYIQLYSNKINNGISYTNPQY